MKTYSRGILIGVIVIAVASIAWSYFYKCVQRNPLFFSDDYSRFYYRYRAEDRPRFCWNMLFQPRVSKNPDQSVAIPIMGPQRAFQISEGQEHGPYNSSPPTSGWNYSLKLGAKYSAWRTTRNKTFSSNLKVKTEIAVARLYREFVWITFKENVLNSEDIETLKKLTQKTPLVFLSSRKTNGDADIALSALGRQDKFNLENGKLSDEQMTRIWDFILRYRDKVPPEFGLDASFGADEAEDY